MAVLISNQQDKRSISAKKIQKTAQAILGALASPDAELSLLVLDDDGIAPMNRQYLGRNGPTNVIAFPMQEGDFSAMNPHLLGDVVISVETCQREAEAAGMGFDRRFTELLIHGILHLFGYDHEKSSAEADRMFRKTEDLLAQLDA
ncbi:MAG: rRNA maturation RNase YbeY [Desulfobacterales bacterium]|nr:rRNA maturation RNase YbeY [Desulfobacterales bacterium]